MQSHSHSSIDFHTMQARQHAPLLPRAFAVHVSGFPYPATTEKLLYELFLHAGPVQHVTLVPPRLSPSAAEAAPSSAMLDDGVSHSDTAATPVSVSTSTDVLPSLAGSVASLLPPDAQPHAFGFVYFWSRASVDYAARVLDGVKLWGCPLRVVPSEPRSLEPSPSPSSTGFDVYLSGLPAWTDEWDLHDLGTLAAGRLPCGRESTIGIDSAEEVGGGLLASRLPRASPPSPHPASAATSSAVSTDADAMTLTAATVPHKGFGFLVYASLPEAERAMSLLNGLVLEGSAAPLVARLARSSGSGGGQDGWRPPEGSLFTIGSEAVEITAPLLWSLQREALEAWAARRRAGRAAPAA